MERAKQLMDERDEIDRKIEEHEETLKANGVDMNSPLVDAEGYPIASIDTYAVRAARNQIICLRNDRKTLTDRIEQVLVEIHNEKKETAMDTDQPKQEQPLVHRTSNDPFVKIKEVMPNSPAHKAMLQADDVIVQFGPLHAGNFGKFEQLSDVVKASINQEIAVTVLRQYRVHRLKVVPGKWSGNGVLGCTFAALK
ncbi:putative 26S proteasome non-ATPase regulatory subunit 9 [Aphelenchoides avenae]|nr:putative 26S proteasome non-ATPase regulatory subunit 9 [Aphelenchus avenae]